MDIWNHEEANVGQWIYEVVDVTSILKLAFPTAYCLCPDGHLGGFAVDIVVAVAVLFIYLFILFIFCFYLFFIYSFI